MLYYNNDQWRIGTKGRSFLKDPDAPIEAFVVSEAIYPHEIKETWILYNSMDIEIKEPELKISIGEKKDESVFHLDEETFWTCVNGQKQQVYWCEQKSSFQVLNLNKGYVWAKLEVQQNAITLSQMKTESMFGNATKGDRDDKTEEIGFEFTAKQTFTVERFGRAYAGDKLAENAKVTLWDVKTQQPIISEMVGPEAKITEQDPNWMSIDVSSHGKKCEQGKKYRLTLRVTEGMKDKWAENCELQGIQSDFVEVGAGVRAESHGVYPAIEEEVSKYLGNITIFFQKEVIYNASVEDKALKWDDGDVWSPHATMEMTFDPVSMRLADAILPRDKEGNEMRRCIGCVSSVAPGFKYKCSWCNRTNIEQIDKYYHFSSETSEVVCYQCYNDRTDYVPLASKSIENAAQKSFRDLWGTCAYVQKVPPLFPKLEKLLADDTKYRKGPHSYVGSLDELRDAAANASITLSSPQGESVLESILREHEKLVELEHIARFRRALQKCEYDELVSITEIKILEKIDWSTGAGAPSETIQPETQNKCLRYVQQRLLTEITGEELPDLNTEEPSKVQKEIDTIKNLVKLADQLKEDPTAEPPKVVSQTVQQTIWKLFSSERLEFENGKIWLDSLSHILNSDLVKALLDIPESYAQTLVNWFFKDRKPGDDNFCVEVPEPILRSPTLQRMRTFTKVASLDLQDQKAKKMAQDQTHLFAEVAKAMDLHTLLELVRKDVHGFGLKGLEPDFSQNILSTVIRSYKKTAPENRPPESIYNNVLVNIIDRMIEMQFWDEIKYTIQNVSYPDSIKDKIHSYELVMKLKSNVNGPDIIQKILLNEVSNLDDIRNLLAEIKNGDEENIRKLLSLPDADRKHMIILFDTDEVDYNVDCSICFSLPALVELSCKHKICANCVKALKKSYSSRCPFCRTRIT